MKTRQECLLIMRRKKRKMKFRVSAMVLVAPMLLARGQSIVVMSAAYSWQSGMISLTFQKKAKNQDYKNNVQHFSKDQCCFHLNCDT